MESVCTPSSLLACEDSSAYDEVSMDGTIILSDCLEDLKSLRSQLYSAAEYFEVSYTNNDQKQIVANTLKDYAIQALVNTVDHLGSVTHKVNNLLDEKVDEISGTELSVFCVEQVLLHSSTVLAIEHLTFSVFSRLVWQNYLRLRTCQDYIDHQGLAEQSLAIATPKYQTHYILPGNSSNASKRDLVQCQNKNQDENGWNAPRVDIDLDILPTIKGIPPSLIEKPSSPSLLPQPLVPCLKVDKPETRPVSPIPSSQPLVRSGTVASRSSSPTLLRSEYRYPSLPRRSASIRVQQPVKEEAIPSKGKRLFNALLGRRKWKEDPMLYTYLDEY